MIKENLMNDMKAAMKSGNPVAVGVLRMIISAVKNKEIEKKIEVLPDAEVLQVIMMEAKKRKDSTEAFTKGGRKDLADKELTELKVIQKYLPQQMSKEDVEKAVAKIVKKVGSKEMGPVMKAVMAELRGKADSGTINEAVKKEISH